MKRLIDYIEKSIEDEYFSKSEKRSLKDLLAQEKPDENQIAFIRSKIFDLANSKINEENYLFIMQWVEETCKALVQKQKRKSSEAFFSPGDSCKKAIIHQISQATAELEICVFTISDNDITREILTAGKKGVRVRIITDNDKLYDLGSDIKELARKGIEIKVDKSPDHMHHKFMIADHKHLLTGSYNWTRSAAKVNHENILITEEQGLVKSYSKEFERLWKEMIWFDS